MSGRGNTMETPLEEQLITAWVRLTGIFKNTRITKGMVYNEAIVMLVAYNRYREDGRGLVSFKEIVSETRMLKSLVNRTIDSLVAKGYLTRCEGKDKRTTFIRELARNMMQIIGTEDAEAFVRISDKIAAHTKA